jgi:membrane protein involved in colicin uptake
MAAASLAVIIIGAAWLITESLRVRSQLNQLRANQQSQDAQRRELEQLIAGERARNQDLTAQLERERNAESERAAQREAEKQTNPVSANTMLRSS